MAICRVKKYQYTKWFTFNLKILELPGKPKNPKAPILSEEGIYLSPEAKLLWAYIFSRPENWNLNRKKMQELLGSDHKLRKATKELKDLKLLNIIPIHENGVFNGSDWVIAAELPDITGIDQDVEYQHVEYQHVENHTNINKENSNSKETIVNQNPIIENKDCFPNKEKDLVDNLFDYGGIDLSPNKPQESPSIDSDAQIPIETNKPPKNSKETPKETVLIEGVEYQIPKNRKIRVGRRVYHCPKYYPQQFIDLIYFTYPDDSNMVQAVKKWDQKCKEGDIEEPDFELIKEDILWRIDNDPKWLDGFVQNPQTYLHNLRWNETKKTAVAKISSSQSFKQQERDRTKEIFRKNAEVAKQIGNPLEEFALQEDFEFNQTVESIEDGVITLKPDITGSYSPFDSETEI